MKKILLFITFTVSFFSLIAFAQSLPPAQTATLILYNDTDTAIPIPNYQTNDTGSFEGIQPGVIRAHDVVTIKMKLDPISGSIPKYMTVDINSVTPDKPYIQYNFNYDYRQPYPDFKLIYAMKTINSIQYAANAITLTTHITGVVSPLGQQTLTNQSETE